MLVKVCFSVFIVLFLASCSSPHEHKLKISATTWIGYTPLFYAKEKGWLKPLDIKVLKVSSLSENMHLYEAGNADAYVGTQYEYEAMIKAEPTLMPIMMFDRSNGGDMVMSNTSITELQKSSESIDVYLELDSINRTLFDDFIERYKLEDKKFNYFNKNQAYIATLNTKNIKNNSLVITYIPYNSELEKNGFKELVSTKDGLELFVVDALFVRKEMLLEHKQQFIALKKLVDKAIIKLKEDPYEFYTVVKPYMTDISYEEFQDSLEGIIWINTENSPKFMQRMKTAGIPIEGLI